MLSRALRENGGNIEFTGFNPFVVSLSNHPNYLFNSLLKSLKSYDYCCFGSPVAAVPLIAIKYASIN